MELILDVKMYIASYDQETWIKMMLYDDEFHHYAYSDIGKKQFVNNFYQCINNLTYLFNKLHSINDEPARIDYDGDKYWYYDGKIHRENDLPAVIDADGDKYWYYNGKRQRK